jgi:hypothetical protein
MAVKKSDLYSSIWASCDELRGMSREICCSLVFRPPDHLAVLLPFCNALVFRVTTYQG